MSAAERISAAGAELCYSYACERVRSTASSVAVVKVWGKSGLKEEGLLSERMWLWWSGDCSLGLEFVWLTPPLLP